MINLHGFDKVIHALTRNDKNISLKYLETLLNDWIEFESVEEIERHISNKNKKTNKKIIRKEIKPDWL